MTRHRARTAVRIVALALFAFTAIAPLADARPGGGHTFSRGGSGGGSHSGGGDGGGDFSGLFDLLFWLVFRHPLIGIPLVVFGLWIAYKMSQASDRANWDVRGTRLERSTAPPPLLPTQAPRPPTSLTPPLPVLRALDIDGLREHDADFSVVLFEDFAQRLYATAHLSRHDPSALAALSPYVADAARGHLGKRQPEGGRVRAVVVGASRILGLALLPGAADRPPRIRLSVSYEANLHVDDAFRTVAQYAVETWHYSRSALARTKAWKGARTFGCPNCGAPFAGDESRCASCGQAVANGTFDWMVEQIDVSSVTTAPPALGGTAVEEGTERPTVVDPDADGHWATLVEDDPATTDAAFGARLSLMFVELQAAWSGLDLRRVRPYVSDALHSYLQYWIEAYKAQGLRNVVDGASLERWERVKVTRDRHYDAVTVRLFGRGRDYTIESATSRVVGGDPAHDRRYSEYWTLIRGAATRGAPRAEKTCPSCAAALDVNMAGSCSYCGVLVTTGDFDWVLSRIEQDDVYAG